MSVEDIEERLRTHNDAFEGLLSLIPAKYYDPPDEEVTSNQWKKRKQSKQEAKEAKRAKLDPDNVKSAADSVKAQQIVPNGESIAPSSSSRSHKAQSPQDLRDRNKALLPTSKRAKDGKPFVNGHMNHRSSGRALNGENSHSEKVDKSKKASKSTEIPPIHQDTLHDTTSHFSPELVEKSGPVIEPPTAAATEVDTAPSRSKMPYDMSSLRERLATKIESMRAARNADNTLPTSRSALLESRRKKDQERKERKKQLRLEAKARDGEAVRSPSTSVVRDVMEAEREALRAASGSPITSSYSFGRLHFADDEALKPALNGFAAPLKARRGPTDPKGRLLVAQNHRQRLEAMDSTKRSGIEEKETWGKAIAKTAGAKVRDDEGLLKKAVKRKEKGKKRSERKWDDRSTTVENQKRDKQRKREENLAKRREGKGEKKPKPKDHKKGKKKKARPGFEGGFSIGKKKGTK